MRDPRVTVTCRYLMVLSIAALFVLPGSTAAQLSDSGNAVGFQGSAPVEFSGVWEQLLDCTGSGAASQRFPDFGDSVLQAADDFPISGVIELGQVVALGFFSTDGPMGPVTVEF